MRQKKIEKKQSGDVFEFIVWQSFYVLIFFFFLLCFKIFHRSISHCWPSEINKSISLSLSFEKKKNRSKRNHSRSTYLIELSLSRRTTTFSSATDIIFNVPDTINSFSFYALSFTRTLCACTIFISL